MFQNFNFLKVQRLFGKECQVTYSDTPKIATFYWYSIFGASLAASVFGVSTFYVDIPWCWHYVLLKLQVQELW